MDDQTLEPLWFLSIVILILALIAGTKAILRQPSVSKHPGSRLLRDYDALKAAKSAGPSEESEESEVEVDDVIKPNNVARFQLAPADLSSAPDWYPNLTYANIYEVKSAADAAEFMSNTPIDTIIACSFYRTHAEHGAAQDRALRQLAEAQPAGLAFAMVDMIKAPDVADWASVKDPEVRLMESGGAVRERVPSAAVASGQLHRVAMATAEQLVTEGMENLHLTGQRYPGALHDTLGVASPKDGTIGIEKMKAKLLESVKDKEMVEKLCRCLHSDVTPRARYAVRLAREIRRTQGPGPLLPLLDLSRRLTSRALLGGEDPGAIESLEILLNAALMKFETAEPGAPFMVCMQFMANCYRQAGERLLPMTVELTKMPSWQGLWQPGSNKWLERCREAACQLLINSSVILRRCKIRATLRPLLKQGIQALKVMPQCSEANLTVGNLLATAGTREDAKETLQAQPLKPLRLLAAGIYHGDLENPKGTAFPAAWNPVDFAPFPVEESGRAMGEQIERPRRRPGG